MFTVTALTITLLGTSYAWYEMSNAYTEFSGISTFSENINSAVIFTSDSSFSLNTLSGIPTTLDQVMTAQNDENMAANKLTFTMTPNSDVIGNRQVGYQISLVNLKIDKEFTETEDLKYRLIETIDSNTSVIEGNFKGVTGNFKILKEMTEIKEENLDKVHSYEFIIWLQDSNNDQNELMGKNISGTIKVSTALN